MPGIPKITFLIDLADKQCLLDDVLKNPESAFRHYMEHSDISCCSFQGGFTLSVDGVGWNYDPSDGKWSYDEFWMTQSWLDGLAKIWEGADTSKAYFWEESYVHIQRTGPNAISIEDRHADIDGEVVHPAVEINLELFTEEILREAEKMNQLFAYVLEHAEKLRPSADEPTQQKLAQIRSSCNIGWQESLQRLASAKKSKN